MRREGEEGEKGRKEGGRRWMMNQCDSWWPASHTHSLSRTRWDSVVWVAVSVSPQAHQPVMPWSCDAGLESSHLPQYPS